MIEINEQKRVNIDDSGILTISNDNAKWMHGDTSTNIEGDYVISAESLKRLMVLMTDNPIMVCSTHTSWYTKDYSPHVYNTLITTDKDIAEEVERMNIAYKKAHEELEVVKRDRNWEKVKNENLTRKIEEYNKSRHWWERKLK